MPPKKCSNRVPLAQRETNPLTCFRRGVGVGVRLEAQRQARPPLNTLSIRQLGEMARVYRIPSYSRMRKAELIHALQQAGYPRGP